MNVACFSDVRGHYQIYWQPIGRLNQWIDTASSNLLAVYAVPVRIPYNTTE